MWFIGVEVEQETSAPPPKKNPGSAPAIPDQTGQSLERMRYLILSWQSLDPFSDQNGAKTLSL